MQYPKTHFSVASSSEQLRREYFTVSTVPRRDVSPRPTSSQIAELEQLADPGKRLIYEQQLGIGGEEICKAIENEFNVWTQIARFGLIALAVLNLFAAENTIRFYGFLFAPDFKEHVEVEFGEFVQEYSDRGGRISDHRYYSRFSSSSKRWQFVLDHPILLQLPTVGVLVLLGIKGSSWLNRLVARRITRVRLSGKDDTSVRRFWITTVAIIVSAFWLTDLLFGFDRVVPAVLCRKVVHFSNVLRGHFGKLLDVSVSGGQKRRDGRSALRSESVAMRAGNFLDETVGA